MNNILLNFIRDLSMTGQPDYAMYYVALHFEIGIYRSDITCKLTVFQDTI